MAWYEKFDLEEDPFLAKGKVYGIDNVLSELSYRIESGNMVFLEGKSGYGKSAVIAELIKTFGGKGKVIYFDCGQIEKKVNIEDLLKGKYGFFGKLFDVKPKDMILLLDNANFLTKKNCERIKYYFDNNYVKSVVFTGIAYSKAHFSTSLRDRIGGRVTRLKELTPEQAVELVKKRAPDFDAISETLIKKVYRHSGGNVKKFLSDLSAICEKALSGDDEEVSEQQVNDVLGASESEKKGELNGAD